MVNQNLIANILSLTLFIVSLFISLRAFYLFFQAQRRRLFILGLSMGILSLTAIASYIGDNVTNFPLNVKWFEYTSQTVCFLFILLSLMYGSDEYLHRLIYWQIIVSALLFILLTPLLPASIPNPAVTKTLLGGSRSLICFIIFFYYVSSFMSKETRFSLLMSAVFLLLSVGYWLNISKYSQPDLILLDQIGDLIRISGLSTLLVTIFLG
jgi:uncharacterized membrane protein YhdT